jgi:hypothetical protein
MICTHLALGQSQALSSEPLFPVHAGRVQGGCLEGSRWLASDEGGREATTCCWATVPQLFLPLWSVSKATWEDVVTVVRRRFLGKVGPEWTVVLLNSVSPHSKPQPQRGADTLALPLSLPIPGRFHIPVLP